MARTVMFLACAIAVVGMIGTSNAARDPAREDVLTAKKVIQRLEAAIESIKSFDVRVARASKLLVVRERPAADQVPPEPGKQNPAPGRYRKLAPDETPTIMRQSYRQVFRPWRFRLEWLNADTGNPERLLVFDGKADLDWTPAENSASIKRLNPALLGGCEDYLETFRTVSGKCDIMRIIRQRPEPTLRQVSRDGKSLVALDMPPIPNAPAGIDSRMFGYQITLDPDRNWFPVEVATSIFWEQEVRPYYVLTVTEAKCIGPGVWAATKAVGKGYAYRAEFGKDLPGSVIGETELTVDIAKSRWNIPIPDEEFRLSLPGGTRVHDFIRNIDYVIPNSL